MLGAKSGGIVGQPCIHQNGNDENNSGYREIRRASSARLVWWL